MDGRDRTLEPHEALWRLHFRDPVAAARDAERLLAASDVSPHLAAWCALTLGFHHLFYTSSAERAEAWLAQAHAAFEGTDRRGGVLAAIGIARLSILRRDFDAARVRLEALQPEVGSVLQGVDRFWFANALAATHYYGDRLEEAIGCLYDAFEALRLEEASPHLPTAMSNLAAALVTVGDYAPARELARDALTMLAAFNNGQIELFTRSNLAEAELGLGELGPATRTVESMLAPLPADLRASAQNHYLSIAAEAFVATGRHEPARACAAAAAAILADYPGAFNDVHAAWAAACVAEADASDDDAVRALERAAHLAETKGYLPVVGKALARLHARHAAAGRWREAYDASLRLLSAERRRLVHRASARYYLLRVQHELALARTERDRADNARREAERATAALAAMNGELSRKVDEIEALKQQLARDAVRDPLTGLFNRRYLDTITPGLVAAALRRKAPLAVALVDLDHFKQVNDRHGHPCGDHVLHAVAQLLRGSLRPADVVSRYGGEEFCLVLPDTGAAGAGTALGALAERLRSLAVAWHGDTLTHFTFSAGVAVLREHGDDFPALVVAADRALYEAKRAGRNRVHVAGAQC